MPIKTYIGDSNNRAREIKKLYVGNNSNKAVEVNTLYGGVNNIARKVYEKSSYIWNVYPNNADHEGITFGNGKFVVIKGSGNSSTHTNYTYHSTDGINWTSYSTDIMYNSYLQPYLFQIKYLNNKFILIGSAGKLSGYGKDCLKVAYSTDGINWSTTSKITLNDTYCSGNIAYGNGTYVEVLYITITQECRYVAYSTDLTTWTRKSAMPSGVVWRNVGYGNNKFVAIGQGVSSNVNTNAPTNVFAYSTDGITWTKGTFPLSKVYSDIEYCNNVFVVTCTGNNALYSYDGINWTSVSLPCTSGKRVRLASGNNEFVAVVNNTNETLHSKDGKTWVATQIPISDAWYCGAYGNGKFVFLGKDNIAIYSPR